MPIRWYDNIPILSYILLAGRCRFCKSPISLRYPIVEMLTSIIFLAVAISYLARAEPPLDLLDLVRISVGFYFAAAMIAVIFIDFEFRIIPDLITLPGIAFSLLLGLILPSIHNGHYISLHLERHLTGFLTGLAGAITGAGFIFLAGTIGKLLTGREAMGFGDLKYMAMLGGYLGMLDITFVFVISCLLGAVYGVFSWILTKDRYIAYGPFISIAGIMMIIFRENLHELLRIYRRMIPL
jgi:leader peptidase (prepilin peptidase)/N-methyltransferase